MIIEAFLTILFIGIPLIIFLLFSKEEIAYVACATGIISIFMYGGTKSPLLLKVSLFSFGFFIFAMVLCPYVGQCVLPKLKCDIVKTREQRREEYRAKYGRS